MIKVLATDVGGVVVLFKGKDSPKTLKDFAELLYYYTKVPSHIWQKSLEIAPGTLEYQFISGKITPKNFYWELRKIANEYYRVCYKKDCAPFPKFQLFKTMWNNIFSPNLELLIRLKELSAVYKIVLASNLDIWHFRSVTEWYKLDFVNLKESVVSCIDHLLKPDPAFFQLLIKKCGVAPSEIFFFDDIEDNCRSAASAGIQSFRFIDNESFFKELEKREIVKYLESI